ncbi:MAG: toxin-antitoxin system YwqK family antitoxin [Bacteroidota bacterium]
MNKTLILLIFFCAACGDDIRNKRYRNSEYAFHQVRGKTGKWIKVVSHGEKDFPKSKTTYFFDNGNRYSEVVVLDSFPNRVCKFFNTKDSLQIIEKYLNDTLYSMIYEDGHYQGYHTNKGNLKCEGKIIENKQEGKWTYYFEDGITVSQLIDFENNYYHGTREDFYESGELKVSFSYEKGKKNGEAIRYFKNGRIKEVNSYKNSLENGRHLRYFEDGSIEYSGTFWNGKEIDTCIWYYPNGVMKQVFICESDTTSVHFVGELKSYYDTGSIKSTIDILNWKGNGTAQFFDENGILSETVVYENNEPIDSIGNRDTNK